MRRIVPLALAALVALALPSPAGAAGRCGGPQARPWCDTSLSPSERTRLLLAALTLGEKLELMAGDDAAGVLTGEPATGTSDGVPRLGIPTVYYSDGPVGPREGQATAMPGPLALASGFRPELARQVGATIANEVKHKGNDVVHAPTVDIMRTPLAGRTFEGYGEDPYLATRMAVPWIRGAQAEGVIANVKHYAPNSQEGQVGAPPLLSLIGGRFTVDAVIDERTLREIYLTPFEAAVKQAGAGTVMCAYNRINGHPACQSPELLQEILRDDWGFRGFVLSDYGFATKSTAPSVNNGLALDLPTGVFYSPTALSLAVTTGQVSEATIDRRVGEILATMFRFGLFDRAAFADDEGAIPKRRHARVARKVERHGIVLLRNQRRLLPLRGRRVDRIAVIGADADRYVGGGGSSAVEPFSFRSPREAITAAARKRGIEVIYEPGETDAAAASAAQAADVAIVFAADHTTEGTDKPCLSLRCAAPDPVGGEPLGTVGRRDGDALIAAVAGANPRTVAVLETGGPVLAPWAGDVRAILEAWYPGQEGGRAIARVLFGAEPGGRLPVTFPRSESDIPTAGDREQYPGVLETTRFKEGVMVGYRHYDEHAIAPRWPFGFGLSYTRFRFSGLRVGPRAVSARVRNVGRRRGLAVAQLYLGLPDREGTPQPPRQLKGARKVALRPGRAARVRFPIPRRALAHWDAEARRWLVAPGRYRVFVGRSSRDLPLRGSFRVRR